jgi:esterase/lipase
MLKLEQKKLSMALLARVVQEEGWMVATIARYTTIPGHRESDASALSTATDVWLEFSQ